MASYFIKRQAKIHGPVAGDQLLGLARSGKVKPTDEISASKEGPWQSADTVSAFKAIFEKLDQTLGNEVSKPQAQVPSQTSDCPDCGGMVSKRAQSCPHCGAPVNVAQVRNATQSEQPPQTLTETVDLTGMDLADYELQADPLSDPLSSFADHPLAVERVTPTANVIGGLSQQERQQRRASYRRDFRFLALLLVVVILQAIMLFMRSAHSLPQAGLRPEEILARQLAPFVGIAFLGLCCFIPWTIARASDKKRGVGRWADKQKLKQTIERTTARWQKICPDWAFNARMRYETTPFFERLFPSWSRRSIMVMMVVLNLALCVAHFGEPQTPDELFAKKIGYKLGSGSTAFATFDLDKDGKFVKLDMKGVNTSYGKDLERQGFKNFTRLRSLSLETCYDITDADVAQLEGLSSLTYLNLRFTKISDSGLTHLAGLARLTELNLAYCKNISDAGLVHVKGFTSINQLDLTGTQITDAGLVHLKGLTSLQTINLRRTKITEAGVAGLKKALPNCSIYTR